MVFAIRETTHLWNLFTFVTKKNISYSFSGTCTYPNICQAKPKCNYKQIVVSATQKAGVTHRRDRSNFQKWSSRSTTELIRKSFPSWKSARIFIKSVCFHIKIMLLKMVASYQYKVQTVKCRIWALIFLRKVEKFCLPHSRTQTCQYYNPLSKRFQSVGTTMTRMTGC